MKSQINIQRHAIERDIVVSIGAPHACSPIDNAVTAVPFGGETSSVAGVRRVVALYCRVQHNGSIERTAARFPRVALSLHCLRHASVADKRRTMRRVLCGRTYMILRFCCLFALDNPETA